ncbi:MAG: nitrile hydratase subunit beta [Pseudomonadota bacterium]
MDGPHDLGGKQGFGPIDVDEPETPFHHEWEGRMWGLARSAGAPGVTIDWWRHVRELIDPADYLSRPYFDSWAQTDFATYLNAGVFTLEEVRAGRALRDGDGTAGVLTKADALAADVRSASSFERQIEVAPAYRTGDRVHTRSFTTAGHTRLPAYARGRPGIIHAHHGAHLLPDEGAKGHEVAEHLYSVAFAAQDLWPEAGTRRDRVFLDLWESYLVPA